MARVLIVDDDILFSEMLGRAVERLGHGVDTRQTLSDGLAQAALERYDVVYLDVNMPDGNGLDALPRLQQLAEPPEVIIVTGAGDPSGAEMAIACDAWDYVTKSSSLHAMTLPLVRALQYREGRRQRSAPVALDTGGILGTSAAMRRCFDLLAQAAASDVSVLLSGETGTGKELFAAAIHRNSARAERPFVVVDCAALPDTLVESLLFGHCRGAFTGADHDRAGLVAEADGGTLFLDEVGELPLGLQRAFLRVLQEHSFRPLGSARERGSDFRLVAATNRDLEALARQGGFRQDLLYRLRSLVIELPPLRERREDLRPIAAAHLDRLSAERCMPTKGVSPEFFEALEGWSWPGNVRELLQTLESAFAAAQDEPTIFPQHLPNHLRAQMKAAMLQGAPPRREAPPGGPAAAAPPMQQEAVPAPDAGPLPPLRQVREEATAAAEERYLVDLMRRVGGDMDAACRISELSQSRLYALLKKYGVARQQPR